MGSPDIDRFVPLRSSHALHIIILSRLIRSTVNTCEPATALFTKPFNPPQFFQYQYNKQVPMIIQLIRQTH